ncbi:UNVERIFIED_CONTAM: hypothetical protein GTU68_029131 [Idotea baltica]|nr:hypothetical protein [Idotea baltica]
MEVLVNGPLRPAFIAEQLSPLEADQHTGANAFFLGRVRADKSNSSQVIGIEYSSYPAMAVKVAEELVTTAKAKFDIQSLVLFHSTGLVKVGEVSLMLLISSAHRKASFSALEWAVDTLKVTFPAWKKELFADGSHRWINSPGSG